MAVTIDGSNTPTAGGVVYGDGTEYASTSAGTSGQVLLSNGSSAPSWGTAGAATTATNLAGGSAGTVPYQSASGTTAMLAAGSSGQVLTSSGAGAPSWITPSSGAMVYISTITASGASTVDVEGIDSTYGTYVIVASGVYGSANQSLFSTWKLAGSYRSSGYYFHLMRVSSASTAYQGTVNGAGGDANIRVLDTYVTNASYPSNFIMEIINPSAAINSSVLWRGMSWNGTTVVFNYTGTCSNNGQVGPLTGVRFSPGSGTLTGTFRLYGIKNS